MTALERRLRAMAERLIARHGKAVTLRRVERSFDPSTGEVTETVTDVAATASPPESFGLARLDGTLVRAGDLALSLAAKGGAIEPAPETDAVIFDGETWSIVQVARSYAGEQVALYTLHLRR